MLYKFRANMARAVAIAAALVLSTALLAACGGQQGSAGGTQGGGSANAADSGDAASAGGTAAFNGLEEKPVRIATTEEDYQIFNGYPYIELYASKTTRTQIPMGDKLYIAESDIVSENGYYEKDSLSNTVKNLYYPISGLPMLENYGRLIGTYGDIPVIELDRQNDLILARSNSLGNLSVYRCKLVGCTIGWVVDESAIWNQNDLIPIDDPGSLQLTDINGGSRANPVDWEFGETIMANNFQTQADSYVYSVGDERIELSGGDVKIKYGKYTETQFGYDFSKLEPGLYYFEGFGVYKVV